MDEQPIPRVPPAANEGSTAWTQTPSDYPPPNSYAQTTPAGAAPATGEGLTDTAAGALAYVTIIPAIIFLVMAPYNTKPFVKFHAFQCIGLAIVWFCLGFFNIIPILGQIAFILGSLVLIVAWILCIVKASRGGAFKLPVIAEFASKQSGYRP